MTNSTTYMQNAIDHAKVREAESRAKEPRLFAGHCAGWTETPHGKLSVTFVVASGVSTRMPEHMRQTWALDGKRIAKAKLVKLLDS